MGSWLLLLRQVGGQGLGKATAKRLLPSGPPIVKPALRPGVTPGHLPRCKMVGTLPPAEVRKKTGCGTLVREVPLLALFVAGLVCLPLASVGDRGRASRGELPARAPGCGPVGQLMETKGVRSSKSLRVAGELGSHMAPGFALFLL